MAAAIVYSMSILSGPNIDDAIHALASPERRRVISALVEAGEGASITSDQCWDPALSSANRGAHMRHLGAFVRVERQGPRHGVYSFRPGYYRVFRAFLAGIEEMQSLPSRLRGEAAAPVIRDVPLIEIVQAAGYDAVPIPLGVRVGNTDIYPGDEPGWLLLRKAEGESKEVQESMLRHHLGTRDP